MANLLLATGDGTTTNAGDAALSSRLSGTLGHTVTLTSTANILANVAGQDLVVVTATGGSGAVADLSSLTIPVWMSEAFNWDDQGWATTPGFLNTGEYLHVVRNHHPITQTLTVGFHKIYTTSPNVAYLFADVTGGDGACLCVPPTNVNQSFLTTYDVGDSLPGGGTATYRSCLFGVWDLGPTLLTDVGWTLFDRSIAWLLGDLPDCADLELVGTGSASSSAGPYSAANHWTASDATTLDGQTFLVALDLDELASAQDIWGNSSASSGWVLGTSPATAPYGPTYPEIRLELPGGSGTVSFGTQRLNRGRNVIAVSLSGGTAYVSVNGRDPNSTAVTYVAPSGATHYAGRGHGTDHGTGVRLIAAAVLGTAITDGDDLRLLTDRSAHGIEHGLSSEVTSHPNLLWYVDFAGWDGVSEALVATGGGEGSNTLTRVGTVAQTVLPALSTYAYGPESIDDTIEAGGQEGHYHHDACARVRITTNSPTLSWAGAITDIGAYLPIFETSIDVDGVYSDTLHCLSPNDNADVGETLFTGLGSASKTVDLYSTRGV